MELDGIGYSGLGKNYSNWLYMVRKHLSLRKMTMMCKNFEILSVLDVDSGNGFYIEKWKKLGIKKNSWC